MSIDIPNGTSSLRHRPIEQVAVAPQEGVPLRARATATAQQPWRPDDQAAIDLPLRGTRTWVGDDRPAGTGPTRGTRVWGGRSSPAQADVAIADVEESGAEEVAAPVPSSRARRPRAGQPAPKTQRSPGPEVEEEREIVTPVVDDVSDDGEYEEEPVVRRRARLDAPGPRRAAKSQPALRRAGAPATQTTKPPVKQSPRQRRLLWWIAVGALLLFLGYVLFTLICIWGLDRYNDLAYGPTRTFHLDAVVGDHDSAAHPTHFVAMNLAGRIEIVEFPGGDATHARVYVGPQLLWSSAEKAVVSLHLKDPHHTGRPDLEVDIGGEPALFQNTPTFSYVLQNTPDGFKQQAS